jgi:hypothetical protein
MILEARWNQNLIMERGDPKSSKVSVLAAGSELLHRIKVPALTTGLDGCLQQQP